MGGRDPVLVNNIVKHHNYMSALKMLCIKMGWDKEYSWYVLRRDEEKCANGGRKEFIRKATRLLAMNYDGIHNGSDPSQSPRLLPVGHPSAQPLRYPPEWNRERI